MKKKLTVNNNPKQRLIIEIVLNKMILTLENKTEISWKVMYASEPYTITVDSDIDKICYDFYLEYLNLKNVEMFWSEKFNEDSDVIEFDLKEDVELD